MQKSYVLSVGHGEFWVGSKSGRRRVWWDRRDWRGSNLIEIRRSLRSRSSYVDPGRGDCVDAFRKGRGVESGDSADSSLDRVITRMSERCTGKTVGEAPAVMVSSSSSDARRVQDGRENLSSEEMLERWSFLQRLPHKLLRDIGYITVGPSLLSSSKELPAVSMSMLGGSSSQWPVTKTWLQQLSVPAVEAWFAAHRSSQRLGDHFALCIEYVLRHSPHVEVQQLLTSQQVLQRVTEPVRNTRALKALESKLLAQELQVLSPEYSSTTLGESIHSLEAMYLNEKNLVGGEKVGKRKRKLLKKLERVRLRKGKTTTIGEFDFLFEIPAHGGNAKGEEFHHWEVSVKYLLYAGPWEVFGVKSPLHAAWSHNPDTEENDSNLDSFSQQSCERDSRGEEKKTHLLVNATEEDDLHLGEDDLTTQDEHPREVDNFLGCYLGPHVGETLLDRKARLRNQLALSANPCAALMLRDLYINKGADEIAVDDHDDRQGVPEQEDSDKSSNGKGTDRDVVVVPSALLKGYLFYEYKLWRFLERSDEMVSCQGVEIRGSQVAEKASLNTNHWKGWWTRDIMEFADLPTHQDSKWYIVPKLEWLSPVVILQSDTDRCVRVLSLPDFLVTAAQVADEAARLRMPRKRRFLVAEMRWRSDWEPSCGVQCEEEEQATIVGAWVEASRGFVVEDTWPDTRIYRPHGYVVSWSPTLQGRQVGVPET